MDFWVLLSLKQRLGGCGEVLVRVLRRGPAAKTHPCHNHRASRGLAFSDKNEIWKNSCLTVTTGSCSGLPGDSSVESSPMLAPQVSRLVAVHTPNTSPCTTGGHLHPRHVARAKADGRAGAAASSPCCPLPACPSGL